MKRFALVLGICVVLLAVGLVDYAGYRRLRATEDRVSALSEQVGEATRLAQEEAAAATAANKRADEAAARAETAAGARRQAEEQKQQAEEQKKQAETSRTQAMAAAQQATEQAKQAQDEIAQMRREREEELNRMQQALSHVVQTQRTPNGMVMILTDSMFKFDFDKAELKEKNRELLSRIAGILLVSKGYGLSVFGYTDDIGTMEYNQQLSERRAKAVRDYLVESGIDPSIVNTKGFGKTNPLVRGTSASARATNRRVEIALTDSEIKYGGEVPAVVR